jgi:DNA-binding XRE family transcriptional regulator
MNPCPSARPGEGEQEENRQGGPPGLAATEGSEDRGMPILFLLGVPGQSPRIPYQQNRVVAQRRRTLARGMDAAWPRPAIPAPGSRGLGSRQPGRAAARRRTKTRTKSRASLKEARSPIRMHRNAVRMSQTDMAAHLGVTFQQIQKYEKGTNRVVPGDYSSSPTCSRCLLQPFTMGKNASERARPCPAA